MVRADEAERADHARRCSACPFSPLGRAALSELAAVCRVTLPICSIAALICVTPGPADRSPRRSRPCLARGDLRVDLPEVAQHLLVGLAADWFAALSR